MLAVSLRTNKRGKIVLSSKIRSNANDNNNDYTNHPAVRILQLLPLLPKDILLVIFAYLVPDEKNATQKEIENASKLAMLTGNQKNTQFYFRVFKPKLINLGATKLLKHVLYTEIKQVEQMVNANPEWRCCTIPSSLRAALFAAKQSSFSVVMRWHGNLACPAMSFC